MLVWPELGAGWMLVAGFFFAVMGVFVKFEGSRFLSHELVFYRSLTGFVVVTVTALLSRQSLLTRHWGLHLRRSVFGIISLLLYFYALTRLPLATAVALNYTSPLFLALVLIGLSREPLRARNLLAILLGLIGVALVLRPHLGAQQWLAGLAGLLSGLFAGLVFFNVRAMGKVGEPEWRVVMYFTLLSSLVSGGLTLAPLWLGVALTWPLPHPVSALDAPLLLAIGFSALLGQLAMTRAYKTGAVWRSSQYAYFTIVFSSAFDIVLNGEWLSPVGWAGIATIIVGGLIQASQLPSLGQSELETT